MTNDSGMEAVIREVKAAVDPKVVNRGDLIFIPGEDGGGAFTDLEAFSDKPSAVRGGVRVMGAESFAEYYKRFANTASTIYANPLGPAIIGVLDHAASDGPSWERHRVEMMFVETPSWVAWKSKNKTFMGQAEFADFIEDNLADISVPVAAEMLEMVTDLQAGVQRSFRQAINLSNGQVGFESTEVITQRNGTGSKQMTLPTRFTLSLPLYHGTDPVSFTARLRWRINEGHLKFAYAIDRAEDVVKKLVESTILAVNAACGEDVNLIIGSPAATRGGKA